MRFWFFELFIFFTDFGKYDENLPKFPEIGEF